jgi:hypothetical protein
MILSKYVQTYYAACYGYCRSHFTNHFNYAEEVNAGTEPEVLLPLRRRGDMLNYLDFIWEPYIVERLVNCVVEGLSICCTQDSVYFQTIASLVYNMTVELNCPDRVMR